jgi:hypothetical protein
VTVSTALLPGFAGHQVVAHPTRTHKLLTGQNQGLPISLSLRRLDQARCTSNTASPKITTALTGWSADRIGRPIRRGISTRKDWRTIRSRVRTPNQTDPHYHHSVYISSNPMSFSHSAMISWAF